MNYGALMSPPEGGRHAESGESCGWLVRSSGWQMYTLCGAAAANPWGCPSNAITPFLRSCGCMLRSNSEWVPWATWPQHYTCTFTEHKLVN